MESFNYDEICQLKSNIDNLFEDATCSFQFVGRKIKFPSSDYFIRRKTNTHIKVIPCGLHELVTLSNIQALLETKAIEYEILRPRPIVMLALGATQPYSRARIATFDGFYFANKSNSLKMSIKTLNNYEQLIE